MKNNEFKLSFIKKLVEDVQKIIQIEDLLLHKIREYDYFKDL